MLTSLVYVSRNKIVANEADAAIEKIIAQSLRRNVGLEVSGALVFTGDHFAQVIEGPLESLELLMTKIRRDDRHAQIDVIRRSPIDERSFSSWSMAYSGPSTYVASHIRPLLEESADAYEPDSADRLITIMQEFGA